MSIIRNHLNFSANFVQIPNEWMRDGRLSHRARGILAEVMTHSDGWEITIQYLVKNGTEGREAVRTAIKELVEFGYLRQVRAQDERGRMQGSQYVVQIPPADQESDPRVTGFWATGIPAPQEPATKNTNLKEHQESKNTMGAADADAQGELVTVTEEKPWASIAKTAFDSTEGALPYMGMYKIAEWGITKKRREPAEVEAAIASLWRAGRAVTKQTVGQYLDGITAANAKQAPAERMAGTATLGQKLQEESERRAISA